jgi:hypothetical protein
MCETYVFLFDSPSYVAVFSYHSGMEGINDGIKCATNLYWIAKGLKSRGAKLEIKMERVRHF